MVAARLQAVPRSEVSFGHCSCNVGGLDAGQAVRISKGAQAIYCRLAWDLEDRLRLPDSVALDLSQCAALSAEDGAHVDIVGVSWTALPKADFIELRQRNWSGPTAEHTIGLPAFCARAATSSIPDCASVIARSGRTAAKTSRSSRLRKAAKPWMSRGSATS